MKTTLLLAVAMGISAFCHSQDLAGKLVYSHLHIDSTTDSIFVLQNDMKTVDFVTIGCRPRVSHTGKYMAFTQAGPYLNPGQNGNTFIRNLTTQQNMPFLVTDSTYTDYYDFSADDQQLIYAYGDNIYTTYLDGADTFHFVTCTPCDNYGDDPTVRVSDSMVAYHDLFNGLFTVNYDGTNAEGHLVISY